MKITSYSYLFVACSLPLFALVSSCSSPEAKNENVKTVVEPPALETFELHKGKIASSLQIPAELMAYRQVDLYAKVNSFIKDLKVDLGSEVRTGQLLATLEAPELSSQLAAAESKLKSQEAIYMSSNATYNRLLETSKTPGTISKNDLDIAMAKKNSDLAQLEAIKASYKEAGIMTNYLNITAPFDGIITSRNVNLGAYVGPSGKGSELPVFTLQELRKLRLVVLIPEAYKSLVKLSDEVKFTVKAIPDHVFSAKIIRRAGALDTKLRSERVELDVINADKTLSPGMVAEAIINLSRSNNTFVVPKSALINTSEGLFLIKVVNKKTERVEVTKGQETVSEAEVFGNVNEGDVFVAKASEEIRNGTVIQ
ncbi:efflux RND transporter periplasmic adaptor subunit [Runella sp.]|uniref:efflux RND transporter periplasmic adaptor subunit n=1 Tax=Runella sp. TaxID=1960881 RepID=UPI003D0D5731